MLEEKAEYLIYRPDQLLTPRKAAEYLGMSSGWFANQRYLGRGPRYVKFGLIRYRFCDLLEFVKAHKGTDRAVASRF